MCIIKVIGGIIVIELNTLNLVTFDKSNHKHLTFLKKLIKDKVVLERFQGFSQHLLHNFGNEFFDRGFLILIEQDVVGYVDISNYNYIEDSVYLRCAIDKDFRGKAIGKRLLSELTNYIFDNYSYIGKIRLKIADDNTSSLKVADACGFKWEEKDYYTKFNPLKENVNKL